MLTKTGLHGPHCHEDIYITTIAVLHLCYPSVFRCIHLKCVSAFIRTKKPCIRVSRTVEKKARNILAEVEEQPFKHQHRTRAAEDSERLSPEQTEHAPGDRGAQEALQNALVTQRDT